MKINSIIILLLLATTPRFAWSQVVNVDGPAKKKAIGVKVIAEKIEPPLQIRTYEDKTNKEDSEEARKIFRKANKQFESRDLTASLVNYKAAYKKWDHPRILFNMGVTLAMLSRPLEAANMFKAVLEFGPEPVGPLRYKEAREKWLELMGTLSILRLKCNQQKVQVYIDGDQVATCPANKNITLNSGRHLLTASRKGYISENTNLFLPRGIIGEREIKLKEFQQGVRYKTVRRIPLKWTIIGASAAALLLAGGGYAIYKGRSDIDSINQDLERLIPTYNGRSFPYDDSKEQQAILFQNVGFGVVSLGVGAAITAGFLYLFKDKQVPETYTVDEDTKTDKASE